MTRYADDSKERVRDAVDMVDLVQTRTELRRSSASSFMGRCPFHDERTPSFSVNPLEKVYYCFGCQRGGDVFSFVMETEGVDFKGALELLADRYAVQLELVEEDPQAAARRTRRERLLTLLDRTASFYERVLWEAREAEGARAYLAGRGLREETLRAFRVGYAPSAFDRVLVGSQRGGFGVDELVAAGLAQRNRQGNPYDRFRSRVMFPLADLRGRVLGFGARALRENQRPKYLNSSDGELYHKGRQLFGADRARAAAAKLGAVVVVEGYTDVLALHQAGLEHAVALMGTALTEEQAGELGRLAPRVELALDADRAGQDAMLRVARTAAGRKLELRVVPLPAGRDPAEIVTDDGPDAMRSLVDASVPFVRFQVERILEHGDTASPEGKDQVLEELRPVLDGLPVSATREELVRRVADRLDLSEALVGTLLARPSAGEGGGRGGGAQHHVSGGGGDGAASGPNRRHGGPDRRERAERAFLALCIALPEPGGEALRRMSLEEHFTSPLSRCAAAHLRERLPAPLEGVPSDEGELAGLLAELVARAGRDPASPAALEVSRLQLEKARIERALVAARESGRLADDTLAVERERVGRQIDAAIDRAMEAGEG